MLLFYLICLIVGGVLLGVSLFGGDSSEISEHSSLDDLHIDSHSIEVTSHSEAPNHSDSIDAVKFFSLRNITYFFAFFGLTGTLLNFLGSSQIFTFLASIFLGTISATTGYKLLKYLKSTETGDTFSLNELIGKTAVVSLPMNSGSRGKIVVEQNGQTFELPAEISKESLKGNFSARDNVIILEIINNNAIIIESDI